MVLGRGEYHIIFLSGAPGAGKTLVGLEIVMRGRYAGGAVFVTGNAPLVDVLNEALKKSYRAQGQRVASWTPTGYRRADASFVAAAASFKIVKAHNFLGNRGVAHRQDDGRVLDFDEAQRTYESGHIVLGQPLEENEADLIFSDFVFSRFAHLGNLFLLESETPLLDRLNESQKIEQSGFP